MVCNSVPEDCCCRQMGGLLEMDEETAEEER